MTNASCGWGPNVLVVSGGCDKVFRPPSENRLCKVPRGSVNIGGGGKNRRFSARICYFEANLISKQTSLFDFDLQRRHRLAGL